MCLQTTQMFAFVVTLGAAEWFIPSVNSFMPPQISRACTLVLTLGAAEWFIPSVGSFMLPQMT